MDVWSGYDKVASASVELFRDELEEKPFDVRRRVLVDREPPPTRAPQGVP